MAAPLYTWRFIRDDSGADRTPREVTRLAATGLETKIGTLLVGSGIYTAAAGASASAVRYIAAEATTAAATQGDEIKCFLIYPYMIFEGTADADASALAGYNGITGDLNADGSLDVADTSNGCFGVCTVENAAGTKVQGSFFGW